MGASGSRQNALHDTSSDGSTTPSTSTMPRKVETISRLKVSFKRKPTNRSRTAPFKELIKSWPISDLNLLLEEFEADAQLLKLQNECDLARKSIKSVGEEFREASEEFGDLEVQFKTLRIRVHRQFLLQRCKNLQIPPENSNFFKLPANFDTFQEEDVRIFLTEQLYSSEKVARGLKNEFGVSKKFAEDMGQMYRCDLKRGDLVIVVIGDEEGEMDQKSKHFEIRCSSTIASARSRLIRSLLDRKNAFTSNSPSDVQENKISFSDKIFPTQFAALFIHFLYTDSIDWNLATSSEKVTVSSLTQAKAITLGKSMEGRKSNSESSTMYRRAMQILQVARFFGVEGLVRACEDVIIRALCPDNVISILQWSQENSSVFIKTHAFRLLESQFHKVSASPSFFELSKQEVQQLVESHFLQTTELDLLNAVVRWGEHALLKRLEEREPNVVADTCHSISRRGLKKTELSGEELREILTPLTSKIRVDYAIPPFHENLTDAYTRGILTRSPLELTVCQKTSEINPDLHWLKPVGAGPRYFIAYHKELEKWRALQTSGGSRKWKAWKKALEKEMEVEGTSSESSEVKSPEMSEQTSSEASESSFHVEFRNLYPQLLPEPVFLQAKQKILENMEKWAISELGRDFHRNLALEMITRRALAELDISPECFDCHVANGKSTPPDLLPPKISGIYDIF